MAALEAAAAVARAATLDLDRVLAAVCREAAESLGSDRAAVYLHSDRLRLAHLYAPGDGQWRGDGGGAAQELARTAPLIIEDVGDAPYLDGPWGAGSGVTAVLAAPLAGEDEHLGLLVVARAGTGPFPPSAQRVAAAIAQQAGRAVANARLHAELREKVARLEELNRSRADAVTGLVHDLRTPLTGLLGLVRTLRGPGAGASPAQRDEQLGTILRQGDRLARMIDDVLLSARKEAGSPVPDDATTVTLPELVPAVLEVYDPEHRSRIRVRAEEGVAVRGDPGQLLRVVQNLVDNALRHSPAGEPVVVRVSRAGDEALLEVCDRGEGIPAEQVAQLFDRFASGGSRPGSTGFGLYLVRGIVTDHGGTVSVTSTEGGGTTVGVRLPALPALS